MWFIYLQKYIPARKENIMKYHRKCLSQDFKIGNSKRIVVCKSKLNIPIRKQRSTGIESGRIPEPFQEALNQEDDENIEIYIAAFLYGTASAHLLTLRYSPSGVLVLFERSLFT